MSINDRRTVLNTNVYSSGTSVSSKFVFVPLLANVHLLHVKDSRNVR